MAPQCPFLICATAVTLLTCALTLSSSLNDASQNPCSTPSRRRSHSIPTQNGKYFGKGLLGSATENNIEVEELEKLEEYVHGLGIFAKNIMRAAERQLVDPTAVHGVTPFSDLSEEEFDRMYRGMKKGPPLMNDE